MVQHMSLPALLVDGTGCIVFANVALRELLGRAPPAALIDLVADPQAARQTLRDCLRSGQASIGRLAFLGADDKVDFRYRGVVLRRKPSGGADEETLIALMQENLPHLTALQMVQQKARLQSKATQRKYEAVRRSEARLKATWSSMADPAVATNAQGLVVRMSRAAEELTQTSSKLALGRSVADVFDLEANDAEALTTLVMEVLRGRDVHALQAPLAVRVSPLDGTAGDALRLLDVRCAPILTDGLMAGAVVTLRDVTLEQQVRQSLSESEARLREFVDNAPWGMLITDASGSILDANTAAEAITGRSRDELLFSPYSALVHPSEAALARKDLAAVRREGRVSGTRQGQAPGRESLYLHMDIVQLNDGRNIAYFLDVTDQLATQEELRQVTKMESVGRLAGGIAHDFNNLLTVMRSAAGLALNALDDEQVSPEALRPDLDAVLEASHKASVLTRDLLAFSRKQTMVLKNQDLSEALRALAPMLERLVRADIELTLQLDPVWVRMDLHQMEQVVLNLAVNACDAMPRGGVLTVRTKAVVFDEGQRLPVRGMDPGRYGCLMVCDNGSGIDPALQDRIFEPFFTTKAVGSGTGMGLSSVHGIVTQSNGFIRVISRKGEGARFEMYFSALDPGDVDA